MSLKPSELGWAARATGYSPKWVQRGKETGWGKKSRCLKRNKEQPLLLLRPNKVLGQNRMKSLQHEWNACGITIPAWFCNIKKWLLQACNDIPGWLRNIKKWLLKVHNDINGLIELTVPWEENWMETHERKKNWYETLHADCKEKGWICHVIPIEVGCYGFLGHSVISFLSKIGITGRSLKVASYHLQTMVQYASSWIWSRVKSLQHQ